MTKVGSFIGVSLFVLIGFLTAARAQEVRSSLASPGASQVNKFNPRGEDYTMKLGPVLFQLGAGIRTEYNDNINLSERNRQDDVIVTPSASLSARWPISALNTLTLSLGVGYSKYLFHPEADTTAILITPDSALSFDLFVGDFKINFHDAFSIQQNPVDQFSLSGVSRFGRFVNQAGVSVDWDLNDVILSWGYDYSIYRSLERRFRFYDRDDQSVYARASFRVTDAVTTGLQVTATQTEYLKNFNNDGTTVAVGPFVDWQISQYLRFNASAGYSFGIYDDNGLNGDRTDQGNVYGNVGLTHRVNRYVTQTITAGFGSQTGFVSNFTERTYLRHEASWRVVKDVSINSNLFIERGEDSGGLFAESATRWGGGVGASYQITEKLAGSINYDYIQKDSDLLFRDYYQNRVGVSLNYEF